MKADKSENVDNSAINVNPFVRQKDPLKHVFLFELRRKCACVWTSSAINDVDVKTDIRGGKI